MKLLKLNNRFNPDNTTLGYPVLWVTTQCYTNCTNNFSFFFAHSCSRGDYLKVYSEGGTHGPGPPGVNEYSAWSRVLCGSRADAPPALYSHGPLLVLEFHSAERPSNATGFVGTYRFIDRRKFLYVLLVVWITVSMLWGCNLSRLEY